MLLIRNRLNDGPEAWGHFTPRYGVCELGVQKLPISVSSAQIEIFAKLFPMNVRPAQNLNRRFLLASI